ncbi:hypothetical protein NPX99_01550 [Bartonella sp. 220]|uniref:hypothetical protein n=1 Tax=Bartonella sp. 220B TaxID=2967260 RepID=UPI0022A9CAB9|nr:hypothetical protein [Bartonella sp. 220B]MCZ2157977.1 hypothetical protein [Bartonella sp. 220B]
MVDDMIMALYEQQQKDKASEEAGGYYCDLAFWGDDLEYTPRRYDDIPQYTEYETLKKIIGRFGSMPGNCEVLCICKRELLSLLYDTSSDYKAAREIFIHYKMLIDAVKEGYLSFDFDNAYYEVKHKLSKYKKRDKEKKKDLCFDEEPPTFEEAYKLGVIEWMKSANKECYDLLIFWKRLVKIGNSIEKLKIIFGDEKVEALREAIEKEQEQFASEIEAAILRNQYFRCHKSRAYLTGYLQ